MESKKTYKEAIAELAALATVALGALENETTNSCQKINDLEKELAEARAEICSLMFLVKSQRCCRNCGNHASWSFDVCGFGENPTDPEEGPHCRRNDLKRWRPMEYRYAKEAVERGE